jgi:hypothetical protein
MIPDVAQGTALPRSIIEPHLFATVLAAQDVRVLFRNAEWIAIESRNAQLAFVEELAQKDRGITLNTTCLADVFDLTRSCVRTVRAKEQK